MPSVNPSSVGQTPPFRGLRPVLAWPVFLLVRALESVSPPWLLRRLLWPLAAARVLAELPRWPQWRRGFRALPQALRPTVSFPQRRLRFHLGRFLSYFPDRLAHPRWLDRCRCEGWRDWMNDGTTPVVFAALHFGAYLTLPYWLRASGVRAATLVGEPVQARSSLKRRRYELTPFPQLPVVFSTEEVRGARRHLAAGNSLVVMMDGHGRRARVPFADRFFNAATGAARFAAATRARLVPCLIAETAPWRFTLFFGTPVPEDSMNDDERAPAHCLGEFLKVIAQYPEQCGPEMLRCIQRP